MLCEYSLEIRKVRPDHYHFIGTHSRLSRPFLETIDGMLVGIKGQEPSPARDDSVPKRERMPSPSQGGIHYPLLSAGQKPGNRFL